MPIVSMLIACRHEQEVGRKKEGDIIAVVDGEHQFGVQERKKFLIVKVNVGDNINVEKAARALQVRSFSSDEIEERDDILLIPTAKRRFCIRFEDLMTEFPTWTASVNWSRVRNPEDTYQPLEGKVIDQSKVRRIIWDKYNNSLISADTIGRIVGLT